MPSLKKALDKVERNGRADELEASKSSYRSKYNSAAKHLFGMTHHLALIRLNQGLIKKHGQKTVKQIAEMYSEHMGEPVYTQSLHRQMKQAREFFNIEDIVRITSGARFKDGWNRNKKELRPCCCCGKKFMPDHGEYICYTCLTTPEFMET